MRKLLIYISVTVWVVLAGACTGDFEEMNKNPFNPTSVTVEPVFNKMLSTLVLGWQEQAGLHNTYYYYYSQQAGRFGISGYLLDNSTTDIWKNYYTFLSNYRLFERELLEYEGDQSLDNIEAMGRILKAYRTLRLVDMYGDMPYSLAGLASEGSENFRVAFDDDQEIYKSCLTDLKWAADNLSEDDSEQFSIGTFDTVLNSDILAWKKWANSLILRHSLRIYDAESAFAGELIAAILGNSTKYPLIEEGEDMCLWPQELDITFGGRTWSFESENMLRMGTAMWESMSDDYETDGSGIFDPRCTVFFEPNDNDEWVPYPQNPTADTPPEIVGQAYKTSRDTDWEDKGGTQYSGFNYFLVRDKWDIPEIIQSAAEVKFLKAEAYARGTGVSVNLTLAQEEYESGVRESIKFWYDIVDLCEIWTYKTPVRPDDSEVDIFLAHSGVAWDSSNSLELIYKQRWINAFRQPWEGMNLWNRTNMTPRDTSGPYVAADYEFFRIHYPIYEQSYNNENWSAATNSGADDTETVKLFWQK